MPPATTNAPPQRPLGDYEPELEWTCHFINVERGRKQVGIRDGEGFRRVTIPGARSARVGVRSGDPAGFSRARDGAIALWLASEPHHGRHPLIGSLTGHLFSSATAHNWAGDMIKS
jgi:hypothetical protein